MSVESPVKDNVAVSTETVDQGIDQNASALDESTTSAVESSAEQHKDATDQSGTASSDEGSESGDTNKGNDPDAKWIGKRLERAKAQEREKVQAELDYWKKAATSGKQPETQPTATAPAADKPKIGDYDNIEAFTEALTDWKIDQKSTQKSIESREQQKLVDYTKKAQDFAKTATDFHSTVDEFIKDYSNVNLGSLTQLAYESDVGPQLVYHLAKHPADMERILELPPHRQLIELGKLEDKLSSKAAVTPPKKTNAPAPVTKETGNAPTKKSINDPTLSQAEYRETRMASMKRKF